MLAFWWWGWSLLQQWVFVILTGASGTFSSDSCSLLLSRSQLEVGEGLFVRRVMRWEGLRTGMGLYKQNLGSGAVQLAGWSLTPSSNWCGLLLSIEQRFLFWNYIIFFLTQMYLIIILIYLSSAPNNSNTNYI